MSEAKKPFLSVRNLTVEYTSDDKVVHAVNDVSFDVYRGKTLGLVGETGAGKTTIAKAIIGILPPLSANIVSGEIFLEQEDMLKKPEKELLKTRGSKISMIFQDPMTALNPVMTIGSQISEVIMIHEGVSAAEAKEKACKMLNMVGIPSDRYNEYPHQFSGGMKQRVIIAMALACSPELLLADEPTTALDVTIQAQVLDMIRDLRDRFNTAMIMITHDLGVVAQVCDEVAVIYAGEIIEYASKEELFDHPSHPYTKGLFGAIPALDSEAERLKPIEGMPPDPTDLPEGCKFSPRCPYADASCREKEIRMTPINEKHAWRCIKPEKVGE